MRKRSKYRPKGVHLDTMAYVLSGFKKLTELTDENMVVRAKNHGALTAMVAGTGTKADVNVLIGALNMTEALAAMQIGNDWKPEIRAGLDALQAMAVRSIQKGRFLFTGPELTAVNLAMEIHDAQLDTATVEQLEHAMAIVNKSIASKRAINVWEAAHA